ncbi:MAG: DUF2142 domain-containing protein [Lachnospiraceae bacterium]|nr:DUF2142 domain-containing protein [Lachnospiraceae bacterium]
MKYINLLCSKWENFYEKHSFKIKLIVVLLISCIMFLYGKWKIEEGTAYKDFFIVSSEGIISENLKNGDVIEQEFSILEDSIRGIAVCFATYNSIVTEGTVNAKILDSSGKVISESDIDAINIKDNEYLDILFERDKLSTGKIYTLKLTFDKIENQSIVLWMSDDNVYTDYLLKINNSEKSADLVLREISDEHDIFYFSYIGIMFAFFVLIGVAYFMIYNFEIKLCNIYLVVGIITGIIYMMIIPIFVVPDEPAHIYSAYEVSNHLLGIEDSSDGTVMMRKDDAENGFTHIGINRHYYNQYFLKITNLFVDNDEIVPTSNKPVPTYSYFYFISGLGLTLGRILHFGPIAAFLMGRIFNLAIFILALYYAIKKIPYGKVILFLWALLPITLQQAASYSYDVLILGLSAVIISLSINLAYTKTENIRKSEWIILFICTMLLVPAKSFALIPICILPLIIYFKKYKEHKKISFYSFGILFGVLFIILLLNVIPILFNSDSAEITENIIEWAGEPGYTLGYLLKHPKELFMLICNTIYKKGHFYFETILGSSLGWFELNIPLVFILPYLILLIIAGMRKDDEPIYLGKKMKIYLCSLAVLGIGFACAGMLLSWTPISYDWIEGVQGRYFLPFVILLLLSIRSNRITINKEVDKKLIFSGIWLQMLIVIFIYIRAI